MNRQSHNIWRWVATLLLIMGLGVACSNNQQQQPAKKSQVDQDNGRVNTASNKDNDSDENDDEYDDENDDETEAEGDGDETEDKSEKGGKLSAEDDSDLEEDAGDFGDFKSPTRLKECNDDGKLLDRKAQVQNNQLQCHSAKYPANSYECTRSGIIDYYGNTQDAKDTLARILDKPPAGMNCNNFQMEIDQCGELNNKPYVFFIGTCRGDNGELNIIYHQIPGN